MKLTDLKGEAAIEALADIIEPAARIGKDPDMRKLLIKKRMPDLSDVSKIIKKHKRDVLQIMAILSGTPYDEYVKTVTVFTLPAQLLDLFNDPEVARLFGYAVQTEESTSSSSAMVNIEANMN